jgi:hypothetical protein
MLWYQKMRMPSLHPDCRPFPTPGTVIGRGLVCCISGADRWLVRCVIDYMSWEGQCRCDDSCLVRSPNKAL